MIGDRDGLAVDSQDEVARAVVAGIEGRDGPGLGHDVTGLIGNVDNRHRADADAFGAAIVAHGVAAGLVETDQEGFIAGTQADGIADRRTVAAADDVVAAAAVDVVVAIAADQHVVAAKAVDDVVAAVAEDGVDEFGAGQGVVGVGVVDEDTGAELGHRPQDGRRARDRSARRQWTQPADP